jgi:hypothetical protein
MLSLFAYVTKTPDGSDSLVGMLIPGIGHQPLCFALERIALSPTVRQLAQQHADTTGQTVRLVRYDLETVLDTLRPQEGEGGHA